MKLIRPSSLALAACLSGLAGYVDALGFLYLKGYFVSFMSGNSTRLAVNLAEGNGSAILLLAEIIGGFVIGSMIGALVGHSAGQKRRPAVLSTVAILLLLAAVSMKLGMSSLPVIFMVLAMGAENAIFHKDGNIVIGLTYMTGTLVKIGQQLAASLLGLEKRGWLPPLFLWLGLVAGGVLGAVTYSHIGLDGVWFASLAAFLFAALSIKHRHGRGKHL